LNKKLKVIFDLYFVNPQDIFNLMDKIFIQTIFKAEINHKVLIINFGLIHLFNLWFLVELLTKLFDWFTSLDEQSFFEIETKGCQIDFC
jgi:hypothetical protein